MRSGTFLTRVVLLASALFAAACGGGGSGTSSGGDVYPNDPKVVLATSGPDKFLLFPNPQMQDDGTLQTNTLTYAQAYYEAVDPSNSKDTLDKWKAANRFGVGGTEVTVIVGDKRDLGYGRLLTGRKNADGTLAFMVKNFLVGPYGYSILNLDAAVADATQWHIGTNAIEYSPGPNCTGVATPLTAGPCLPFAKFYTYDPNTGARLLMADLDGRGPKAMPGICISCHGGRGDPLTPAAGSPTGKALFPLVAYAPSQHRGDVQARLQPLEAAAFDYSGIPSYTRSAMEADMLTFNKWVLCSYPIAAASVLAEDTCRRTATLDEWQGTAAEHLKSAYTGNPRDGSGNLVPPSSVTDTYVQTDWANAGQSTLYQAQAQACRACHILRGTGAQSDLNFETYAKFLGHADRIKAHVVDRGNMPLVKLIYDKYWSTPSMFTAVANFLTGAGYSDGALKPGRPVADPGPGRVVKQGPTTLTAAGSLFSSAYQWSIVSGPTGGATLSSTTTLQTTFNATVNGTYRVQLVTSSGATQSAATQITIEVSNALPYVPSALRFAADIKPILSAGGANCVSCHKSGGNGTVIPPIWYTDYDRNGDSAIDSVDETWFYTELRGRINFTDIVASPLLRKPSNHHHNGGQQPGFNTANNPEPLADVVATVGNRFNYDLVLNWILNGSRQ